MCWATWNSQQLDAEPSKPLPEVKAFINYYGVADFTSIADYASTVPHDSPSSPENLLLGDFLRLMTVRKPYKHPFAII